MLKIQSGSFPLNQAQLLKLQKGLQKQGNQKRQSRNIEQEIKKIDKKSHILSKSVHNKFQISLNPNKPKNPVKCFPNHSLQAKILSQSSQNFKNKSNLENEAIQKALKVVEQEIQSIQEEERTQLEKNIQFFQQQFTQLQRKLEKQYKEELEAIDQQLKKNVKTEQLKYQERVKHRIKLYWQKYSQSQSVQAKK